MSSLNDTSINLVMEIFEYLSDIHLLVIESDSNKREKIDEISNHLIDTIRKSKDKKIILICNDDDILKSNLQSEFSTDKELELLQNEEITLANLTKDSQCIVLKTIIDFQGRKVPLEEVITDDLMKFITGEIILNIFRNKVIQIGKSLQSDGLKYKEISYINRTITCKGKIIPNVCVLNLLSAVAGMGKTTLFAHLSKTAIEQNPTFWVIKINLIVMLDKLTEIEKNGNINQYSAIAFLCSCANLETELEQKIFEDCLSKGNLKVFFDAFEEICPDYKVIFLKIINKLAENCIPISIWLSMRPHCSIPKDVNYSFTEKILRHWEIQPFTRDNQINFLRNLWALSININENYFRIFTEELFKFLCENIDDGRLEILGVPLIMMFIGDTFKPFFEEFQNIGTNNIELLHDMKNQFPLSHLFKKLDEYMFKNYWINKFGNNLKNPLNTRLAEKNHKIIIEETKILALISVLKEKDLKIFLNEEKETRVQKYMNSIKENGEELGIVSEIIENKPWFINIILAEFYVGFFLLDTLKKDDEESLKINQHFFNEMLEDQYYSVVCKFINCNIHYDKNSEPSLDFSSLVKNLKPNILNYAMENKFESIAKWLVDIGMSNEERGLDSSSQHSIPSGIQKRSREQTEEVRPSSSC